MKHYSWLLAFATAIVFCLEGYSQSHILPKELIEEYQTKAANRDPNDRPQVFRYRTKSGQDTQSPWLPGEFEETESVAISWSVGSSGRADTTSSLAVISSKLCIGIQPEAKVMIRVDRASDTMLIRRYMQRIGEPLYNYQFVVKYGDAWWTRDFGPIGYYTGPQDSLVYLDFKYYPGRNHDNLFPATSSFVNATGHQITRLNFEGGNLITDGFGTSFYSSAVTQNNTPSGVHFPTMVSVAVADSMQRLLKADQIVQIPRLSCDGGTGHLDLYLKMMDEETWIAAEYPQVITSNDRTLVESNVNFLRQMQSVYNRPFRIFRVPVPTDNNGTWNLQRSCSGLNQAGRSFVNGITVNKTFIYPIWDSPQSGNSAQRLALEEQMKKWFPGLKLFGIDVRAMLGFGGQLHCITMQMPASNPIRFWHPAYRDVQPLQSSYRLLSQVHNKSGIASVTCTWRRKDDTGTWINLPLTDSSGYFVGAINGANFVPGDTIQYYLVAQSNNGKTAYKPITAPEGFYEFVIQRPTSTLPLSAEMVQIFPNPASQQTWINIAHPGTFSLKVFDFGGRLVKQQEVRNQMNVDMGKLAEGPYRFVLFQQGAKVFSTTILKD